MIFVLHPDRVNWPTALKAWTGSKTFVIVGLYILGQTNNAELDLKACSISENILMSQQVFAFYVLCRLIEYDFGSKFFVAAFHNIQGTWCTKTAHLGKRGAWGWTFFPFLFVHTGGLVGGLGHYTGGKHFIQGVADRWQGALRSLPASSWRGRADRWGWVWRNGDGCRCCTNRDGDRGLGSRRFGCSLLGGLGSRWRVGVCCLRLLGGDTGLL